MPIPGGIPPGGIGGIPPPPLEDPAIMSSILNIRFATSDADLTACVLIFNGSITPCLHESTTLPVNTLIPAHLLFFLS